MCPSLMTANCSWKEENCNLCIDFREVVCLEVTQESKAQKNSVILLCYSAHLVFSICQITSGFVVWQSSNTQAKKSFKGGRELSFPFIAWNIRIVLLQQIFLIFKGFYFPFDLWIMPTGNGRRNCGETLQFVWNIFPGILHTQRTLLLPLTQSK